MSDPMDAMFSDTDDDVDNDQTTNSADNYSQEISFSTPRSTSTPVSSLPLKNRKIQALQAEERRSRSRSPIPDQSQSPSFFRNGHRAVAAATNSPTRSSCITYGSGHTRNEHGSQTSGTMTVERSDPRKALEGHGVIQTVTKYPFKLYFILGILSACLYAVFHLQMSVNEVQDELTRTMTNFQTQINSDFHNEFRKLEYRHISEIEDLKSQLVTLASEMSKLMQKVTIKQRKMENSAERLKDPDSDNYYSQMLKYIRIQPEVTKVQEQSGPVTEMDRMNTFRDLLRLQRTGFRSQSGTTWTEIFSGVVSTFSPTSTRPATILLLIPPQLRYTQFPSCFARKLGNDINSVFNGQQKISLKEMSSIGLSDVSSLSKIHEDLKKYFDVEGGRAVLIHNLEKVQTYEILMVFQAFCDNVGAYEKQATFIFTLNVPERIYEYFDWIQGNAQKLAHEVLHEAWTNVLSLDKRAALISRIAVTKILVQDGDSCL